MPFDLEVFMQLHDSRLGELTGPSLFNRNGALTTTMGKFDAKVGISEFDLSIALNYSHAVRSPHLIQFITWYAEPVF